MAEKYMRAGDAISGQEGRAYANINGRVEELFFLKKIDAKIDKNKSPFKAMGHRGEQNKASGFSGTGSMTIYYATSLFREMALEYAKNGKDVYFDVTVINDDPTSTIGKQTVVLHDVNLNSATIALLDVDAEFLEEDVDFTFADFNILDKFGKPVR